MSHHKNADYKIMRKSFLHYDTEKSMQSQTAQIVMNLIFNDNMHLITLENTLFLLRQQVVVNFLLNEQTLILHSHFNNHDNDFLKKIRIKKSADYYNKFFCEHNE